LEGDGYEPPSGRRTLASERSQANKAHYELIARSGNSSITPDEARELGDAQWTTLTGEPGGVDYIEEDVAGRTGMWLVPKVHEQGPVLLCVHGGGFVGGSIFTHRKMYGHLAKQARLRALLVGYSFIDQEPWPAQLDQFTNAFLWLVGSGVEPSRIVLVGDSAGALLVIDSLIRMRAERLPVPRAAMCISGWFDMSAAGASYEANDAKDPFFKREAVRYLASLVARGKDPATPEFSPVHANLEGLPRLYLQVGGDETLLDDSRALTARARDAGVRAELEIFPEMLHSFQMMAGRAPEADEAIAKLARWARLTLGY